MLIKTIEKDRDLSYILANERNQWPKGVVDCNRAKLRILMIVAREDHNAGTILVSYLTIRSKGRIED